MERRDEQRFREAIPSSLSPDQETVRMPDAALDCLPDDLKARALDQIDIRRFGIQQAVESLKRPTEPMSPEEYLKRRHSNRRMVIIIEQE